LDGGDDDDDDHVEHTLPSMSWPRTDMASRMDQDEILLRGRAMGMSYRDIGIRIGWKGSESTLRGRHRSLTKSKEERVRAPVWTDRDVSVF
jgi:hypothetical protein